MPGCVLTELDRISASSFGPKVHNWPNSIAHGILASYTLQVIVREYSHDPVSTEFLTSSRPNGNSFFFPLNFPGLTLLGMPDQGNATLMNPICISLSVIL
jgi:hypothetical protein